jgi:hypothetical protein
MLAGWVGVVLAGAALLTTARPVSAQDAGAVKAAERAASAKSGAELLPPTTLFYVEMQRPAEVIRLLLDHPLRQRLEQSPDYQKAFDTPQFKEFQAVVKAVEQRSGVEWRKALETSTGGGLVVAVDAATQGLVVLSRSSDPKTTESVRDALFSLARDDAKSKGNPDPIQTKEYRGLTAHTAGESVIATVGPWLVVSNKPALSKSIADRLLDGGPSLSTDESFVTSRNISAHGDAAPTAWAYLRMAPVRLMSAGNPVFDASAKSDNPVAELLFGGLAGVLRNTDHLTMSLRLRDNGIKLTVASPNDPKWVPQGRGFFFAPAGQDAGADQPLKPRNTLLSLTTYRDLAAWWEAGPDTYSEGVAAKMAQADSGLSAFLGGKSFGTDILGSFAPQIQVVVASQDYQAAGVPQPTIRLPAGALVFRLREKQAAKADIKKHFRVAFQSITALANLDGASKGRPLLEMQTEKRGQAEILYATYEAPSDANAPADAKPQAADKKPAERDVYYNFSPALVLSGDRLMLCSTKQIAQELADLAARPASAKANENTLLEIAAQPIGKLLQENREQLIAQNMLEKGHSRPEAEKEVDVFVALVNAVKDAKVSLTPTDKTISLDSELETAK